MKNQTTNQAADKAMTDFSSANLPENLTLTNVGKEKVLIFEAGETETFSFGKPKSKKGLGMTLAEAIIELEKGYFICCIDDTKDTYYYLKDGYAYSSKSEQRRRLLINWKECAETNKSVWYIYTPKLKNATQQARVELIEKQRLELFANIETIKYLNLSIKERDAEIADLTDRNDNLKAQVVTANERIEILQHENKNYESAIAVLEGQNDKLNRIVRSQNEEYKWLQNDISNLKTKNEMQTESRERLASKFTNWFIFLVIVSVGSIALNVYQYFTN